MPTAKDALSQAFYEEMERDPDVLIIGEKVGLSSGPNGTTQGLIQKFGHHGVLDTPISEFGFTDL